MNKFPLRFLVFLLVVFAPTAVRAQYPGIQGAVESHIQVLEQKRAYCAELVQKGNAALAFPPDYESAYAFFKSAVDTLPHGGEASSDIRKQALSGFCNAAVLLARQRVSEGRYADARTTVEVVLENRYDPNYGPAKALRSQLMDPQGFADRGTITPRHVANIEEVKRLIQEGEGYYATGRYDIAFKRCEQALNIDKYNIAARRLMEKINVARQEYADAAYSETRGAMLTAVDKAWELPLRKFTDGPTAIVEQPQMDSRGSQAINNKLDTIIIPRIDFTDASIKEALDFIKKRAADLDTGDSDNKGINIVLKIPPDSLASSGTFTLALDNTPLRDVLTYVTRALDLKIKIEPHAVVVVPSSENTEVLITKEYKVPPGFITTTSGSAPPQVSGLAAGSQSVIAARSMAKDFLESQGVEFPPGASANFIPLTSRLIVKNTKDNLEIVDGLVEDKTSEKPTQVEIEAKFLEVSQNNLKELGFDWLLGQFALAGGSGVYGSGGTIGLGRSINNSGYPLINPANNLPVGANSVTSGPITAGNRGGTTGISLNAVDAVLLGSPAGSAPGVLSVAGVFTNPQFQVVLRALSQKKGIDLVSAPKVTTERGQEAIIEIIREFRYPKEFDPPNLSATTGSTYAPVVPASPSVWDTRNTGITLKVTPVAPDDSYTISLELETSIVEFEGFINYGNPINATVAQSFIVGAGDAAVAILGPSTTFEATPNVINQPVFSTRDVNTQVSVLDGQTVVMGGLMREDVQKVEDKVPILGDIPFAGRLFRTNIDQHVKRNMLIFVTASLLDPAGQRIFEADEDDQVVPEMDISAMPSQASPTDPLSAQLPQ
jgi:general secretion pathway protein D